MPYIRCPSCEQVIRAVAARVALDLCPSCGDVLLPPRIVVPLSRLTQERPEPAPALSAA
jgi:hypothetical protein